MVTSLLILLASLSAGLDDDVQFKAAVSLYEELEFEQSIYKLQDIAIDNTLTAEERGRVFMWMGINHGQLGDLPSAERSFKHAVELNADAALPAEVPPAIDSLFKTVQEKHRARLATERPVPIVVERTNPDDSEPLKENKPAEPNWAGPIAVGSIGVVAISVAVVSAVAAGIAAAGAAGRYEEAKDPSLTQAASNALIEEGGQGYLIAGIGAGVAAFATVVGIAVVGGAAFWGYTQVE